MSEDAIVGLIAIAVRLIIIGALVTIAWQLHQSNLMLDEINANLIGIKLYVR